MGRFVITVARETGSGGHNITRKLSDALGVPYYDRDLLRKASEVSGIHEQLFGAADERIGLRQIGQERTPLGADAAHGEPHDERKEHHADDVVPIEKFVAPALRSQLLGVAPRSPAHHRDEAEKHCEGVTVDDKHRL
mgnify:CR=1 FL=1